MSEEDENDSFISRLSESSSEYVDLLTQLTDTGEDAVDVQSENFELAFIKRPSSKDIAEEAHKELLNKVEDESEIPYEDPVPVILEAERQFSMMRDDLLDKLEDIKRKEEESVSGADIDTMLYVIDEDAGKTGKFTLFGGAESLIYNTAEKFGWHRYEAELVHIANRKAARENNLHRHLLLDTVLIVPNSKDLI